MVLLFQRGIKRVSNCVKIPAFLRVERTVRFEVYSEEKTYEQ